MWRDEEVWKKAKEEMDRLQEDMRVKDEDCTLTAHKIEWKKTYPALPCLRGRHFSTLAPWVLKVRRQIC